MGQEIDSKERVLASLVGVMDSSGTPYALIGGVAVQLYTSEPRTTADLDVALRSREEIPRTALEAAGFTFDGVYSWSENWRGPASAGKGRRQKVAVQFSADGLMAEAVGRATERQVGDLTIWLATVADMVLLKLAAASEPRRRGRKRLQDVVDVMHLLDDYPEMDGREVRDRLSQIKAAIR
jgi:hypothetical protein